MVEILHNLGHILYVTLINYHPQLELAWLSRLDHQQQDGLSTSELVLKRSLSLHAATGGSNWQNTWQAQGCHEKFEVEGSHSKMDDISSWSLRDTLRDGKGILFRNLWLMREKHIPKLKTTTSWPGLCLPLAFALKNRCPQLGLKHFLPTTRL